MNEIFSPSLAKYGLYTYIFVHQIAIENVKLYNVLNLTSKHFKYAKFFPSPPTSAHQHRHQKSKRSKIYSNHWCTVAAKRLTIKTRAQTLMMGMLTHFAMNECIVSGLV